MKKCPFCAEEIQEEAVVCRHCGRDLSKQPQQYSQSNLQGLQPTKKTKFPVVIVIVILCLCLCVGLAALLGNKKSVEKDPVVATINAQETATERAKPTPTPIYYDSSRVYPEVVPNLYIEIIGNKKTMTDIQFKDYLASIVGKRLHMKANVYVVQEEYMQMSPVDGGLFDAAFLYDVPREMLLNINKGSIIEFDATVKELDQFIISQLRLGDPVIYTISK